MTDIVARLQDGLGSTYRVERELGGGGMSRVFVALDTTLDRPVVVKVLPPELAAEVSEERFRREIQLAAQLQHPHIVPLLTAGHADGFLFYTMPLVSGESLREKLDRDGALPVDECVRLLCEIADALKYAHSRGIVHRDIKPANVLLADRHAVVADFGVAKALSAAGGSDKLTATGIALGTPAYMAPEQAAGDSHVDHRADIYAFGALAYEMLTGQTPFTGPSVQAVLVAHISQAPQPITVTRSSVPAPLAAIVMRCLEKHPADRPQSAEVVMRQLEAVSAQHAATSFGVAMAPRRVHPFRALALFAVTALAVFAVARVARDRLGLPDWFVPATGVLLLAGLPIVLATALVQHPAGRKTRVRVGLPRWLTWRKAVLGGVFAFALLGLAAAGYMAMRTMGIGPVGSLLAAGTLENRERILIADFENRTADSLLGRVVTEAFRIDFEQSPVVTVVQPGHLRQALARMQRPPDTTVNAALAREIATRDGIKAIIAGEIGSAGSSYAISARLISTTDGEVLASARETARDQTEILSALDKLSRQIRERIGESLQSIRAEPPLEQVTTGSLSALRSYAQGVRAYNAEGDIPKAVDFMQEAIDSDTLFAMAYRRLGIFLSGAARDRARSTRAITKAYEYRGRLSERERLLAVGTYYSTVGHTTVGQNRERALAAYRTLLDSYPHDFIALNNVGVIYSDMQQNDSALAYFVRAQASDSSASSVFTNIAATQALLGRTKETQTSIDKAVARFPGNFLIEFSAAGWTAGRGDYAGAEAGIVKIRNVNPNDLLRRTVTSTALARLSAIRGRLRDAERHSADVASTNEARKHPRDYLVGIANASLFDALLRGAPERSVRKVEEALAKYPMGSIEPLNRPYNQLAYVFAVAGRPDRARSLLAERDAAVPKDLGGRASSFQFIPRAAIAIAERKGAEAMTEIARADDGTCHICLLPLRARAYELGGQPDSAILAYEQYVTTPLIDNTIAPTISVIELSSNAVHFAPTLRRLGELYEERGNREKAAHYYGRFVELWKDADPDLQPQVVDVKRRLARLSGEGAGR
ncbi:MAG: protein kinase [Gemmatimonadota bacterium]|nr:protein kinase [Gemmatimonadota bacterium]